jgi:hypothetical protein
MGFMFLQVVGPHSFRDPHCLTELRWRRTRPEGGAWHMVFIAGVSLPFVYRNRLSFFLTLLIPPISNSDSPKSAGLLRGINDFPLYSLSGNFNFNFLLISSLAVVYFFFIFTWNS